jgi:hypothetical protein
MTTLLEVAWLAIRDFEFSLADGGCDRIDA